MKQPQEWVTLPEGVTVAVAGKVYRGKLPKKLVKCLPAGVETKPHVEGEQPKKAAEPKGKKGR